MEKTIAEQIAEIAARYPKPASALMPALDLMQRLHGNYLSPEHIRLVAQTLGVSVSKAFGVATYYTLYNTKPVGKYHLQADMCVPAFLSGAEEILKHLQDKLDIRAGETTKDGMFTLSTVEDLASCGTCPVIQVNDTYYENLTVKKADELIRALREGKEPKADTSAHYATECNILLKNRGNPKATEISEYKKGGGYIALEKALRMKPHEIMRMVRESMLRGRGGAGFPTATKWEFLPKNDPRPAYLICNADEGEPGTFKDRQIMQYDPHLLIEGIAIAAQAIGSKTAFIYIRGEFRWIADILETAIAQAQKDGQLKHVNIIVHRGAGSYVCGEETGLIESIEGNRGYPRVKPPFPASVGLYGCPTIVNNVETLACLPYILVSGPEAFKFMGKTNNTGPKLYGVCGDVNKPGVYEFPLGTKLETVLAAAGEVKGRLKAVIVGGLSVPILTASEARGVELDFDSCLKAGTMLGSGGIMVINDSISIPDLAYRTIKFYAHESCGQCVPCSEGSYAIKALLEKFVDGKGSMQDFDTVLYLCKYIKGSTICATGDAFAIPIEAMLTKFKDEFKARM
jgi:NADH:ubiquinone oxidoreductase subunit F (NADH-binding)/NADH:ubiquinone oxidoreductase subunit E